MIVCNCASWIRGKILPLAGFSSSGEEESIVQPNSPNRHHMRTSIARVNRSQPESSAPIHLPRNPCPGKQSLAIFRTDNAIARRKRTIRLRLRLRGYCLMRRRSFRKTLRRTLRHNARSSDLPLQLLHRPISLIDGAIGVSICTSVRIRDRQAPKRLACHLTRRFRTVEPELVEQRIVFISISMRPTIHRDLQDVMRRIKSTWTKYPKQLLANIALEGFECRAVKLHASQPVLIACGMSWLAGSLHHVHDDRFIWLLRAFITTDADGKIEIHAGVIHTRTVSSARVQLLKGAPVANHDVGIEQWNFLRRSECFFLRVGQFLRNIRNYHMPTGQNAVRRADRLQLAIGEVTDL